MGRFDLGNAWRLDTVLELARQQGIRLMLCIDSFNILREKDCYNCWETTPHNAVNGGPLQRPNDFWQFNEDITVTGEPHGHILYSWNSGYVWLRSEIRRRLGQTTPDPVGAAIDDYLGVVRANGMLRLEPGSSKKGTKQAYLFAHHSQAALYGFSRSFLADLMYRPRARSFFRFSP